MKLKHSKEKPFTGFGNLGMAMKADEDAVAAGVKEEDDSEESLAASIISEIKPEEEEEKAVLVKEEARESLDESQKQKPEFMKSVVELDGLSIAIHSFTRRLDELQKHLEFIENTIESRSKQLLLIENTNLVVVETITEEEEEKAAAAQGREGEGEGEEEVPSSSRGTKSEVEYLCEMMCSRSLRKYIVSNMSDEAKLREEVPAALKFAPKPAKLVLDCIGRFYLQGSKAYTKNSPMIPARQASLLILEFFLLSDNVNVESLNEKEKDEAHSAALAWRKRLVTEGGLSRATPIDARGLLLFIASFGIPSRFSNQDLRDLILLTILSTQNISTALRRSPLLLARIPGSILCLLMLRINQF